MPDTTILIQMAALLIVIGTLADLLAGLLGVGVGVGVAGGIVLVPAFFYAFTASGYDGPALMQICLATSLATIIVTGARSVRVHHLTGAVDWAILRAWAPGMVIGAVAGVITAAQLRSVTLQAVFGVLALIIALYMALGRSDWRLAAAMPTGPLRAFLATVLGFLSVLMGLGGGSFGVPLMTLYGLPIHRAVATAAGFGLIIAVPAVLGFLVVTLRKAGRPPLTFGAVNLVAFVLVVGSTFVTAPVGAALAHRTDAVRLKRVFGLFLGAVGLNMLRKVAG